MKTFKTKDKTNWPSRGPWDNEPDKAQWIDEASGYDCLIVRGGGGALCGYVGVPEYLSWILKQIDEERPNGYRNGEQAFDDFIAYIGGMKRFAAKYSANVS